MDMTNEATDIDPMAIQFAQVQDKDVCKKVLRKDPNALPYCRYQPRREVERIVQKDGKMLRCVREENQTESICLYAALNARGVAEFIKVWSEELAKAVVEEKGSNLKYVPEKYMTDDIINVAARDPASLPWIPKEKRTAEIILTAVKKLGSMLAHVEPDQELCDMATEENPDNIKYVPEEYQTKEIIWKALRHNPSNIEHVKKQTKEMEEYVVKKNPELVYYIKNKTRDMLISSVLDRPWSILDINKDDDVLFAAISEEADVMSSLEFKSHTFYMIALMLNPKVKRHINRNVLEVIKHDPTYTQMKEVIGRDLISVVNFNVEPNEHGINAFDLMEPIQQREVIDLTLGSSAQADNDAAAREFYRGYYKPVYD